MSEQAQAPMPSPAPAPSRLPQVIHVEGLGFIPLQEGQTVQQAIAAARAGTAQRQADPSSLGVRGGPGQFAGVEAPSASWTEALPPELRSVIEGAIQASPQLAAIAADLIPQTRIPRTALGLVVPPTAQVIGNLMSGQPWSEGVAEEAGLGVLGTAPRAIGMRMADRGVRHAREALATSPRINQLAAEHGKDFVENVLPRRALAARARATTEGVADTVERAANMRGEAMDLSKEARTLLKGIKNPTAGELELAANTADRARTASRAADTEHALGNTLEDLRYEFSMRGPKGGPTAIAPGSGAVTTGVRAAGLAPAVGQVAAPLAGYFKASPVRKLAAASRMHAPFGVNSEEFGAILSQLLRAKYADEQAGTGILPAIVETLTPAVSHTQPRRRKP